MKNVIITGSSGMIGSLVLRRCLDRMGVACVTAIVRKPSGIGHPKLREVVHADLLDIAPITDALREQDVCFFCVGVYSRAVPPAEFRRITVDATASFASALKDQSPDAAFCFLSGGGADRTERSRMMFARDKGAAENMLVRLGFARLHVFRPGYIYPVEKRTEPNLMYRTLRPLWKPLFSHLGKSIGLTSVQLADAMVNVGMNGGAEILENRDIIAAARSLIPHP